MPGPLQRLSGNNILSITGREGMIAQVTSRHIIAPSILSADLLCLGDALQKAEESGADWIHIDVMDGYFAPNLSFGPAVVQACRRGTRLPLDVHLMVNRPDHLLEAFVRAGATYLAVHVEACPDVDRTLDAIRGLGAKPGIALNPATPASAITEWVGRVDLIRVMSVPPGFAGQEFSPEVLHKIEAIRSWKDSGRTSAWIQVDGGVTPVTVGQAAKAGADAFAVATAIFQHPAGIPAGIRELRDALSSA
jgi:ribulose-phosphate 3-epimerase